MRGAAIITLVAALAAPATAAADADETSVHLELGGGLATVGDPAGGTTETTPTAGGAARFTLARVDWLAYEVTGYGLATGTARHTDLMFEGLDAEIERRVTALGVEGGASLRLGVRWIPIVAVAIGPQVRLYPRVPALEPETAAVLGSYDGESVLDLAARVSVGIDHRLSARWVAGVRLDARQTLGLGDGALTSVGATVHVAYYWYARIWTFEID